LESACVLGLILETSNKYNVKLHLSLLALTVSFGVAGAAESWSAFRGPNGSGVSASAKPPAKFGPAENVAWSVDVPPSPSSPCVWGERIFLTTFANEKLETRAYNRSSGKLLWTRVAPVEKLEEFHATEGSPAASTPVTDGRHVVSYFGSCGLFCYDIEGKELWRHPLPPVQSPGSFGTGNSPIIAGGLVLVGREQPSPCTLLAVDLETGTKVWETPRTDAGPGFGTPTTWKNGSSEEVVVPGALKLKAYDLKTGKERWSLAGLPAAVCTTPVTGDGLLFFAGWSPGKEAGTAPTWEWIGGQFDKNKDGAVTPDEVKGTEMETFFRSLDFNRDGKITKDDMDKMAEMFSKGENVLVAVKPGGKGELSEAGVAWKQTRGLPYVASPLHYQGRVYLVKDGGMASCFEAKTGKIIYQQERLTNAAGSYYASPVAADGRILVASIEGKVTVFKAGAEMPEILHQAEFKERIAATPALVGRQLFLRTDKKLYALGR
jgi:outer membrane protein assembly factor BamB